MLTAATILYGDYPKLAVKVLGTLKNLNCDNIVIGLNTIGEETFDLLSEYMTHAKNFKADVIYVVEEKNRLNVGKYPLMKKMLECIPEANSFDTNNYLMWFDDDSYLPAGIDSDVWLSSVYSAMRGATQIGALHRIKQRNKQYMVIKEQPWYTGKLVNERHTYLFATGGWWTADLNFLKQWDYPFPALHHNGGDSILGELIRQQDGVLKQFDRLHCFCESCRKKSNGLLKPMGVVINEGGRAGRRGLGVTAEYYVWSDGNVSPPPLSAYEYNIVKVKDVESRDSDIE